MEHIAAEQISGDDDDDCLAFWRLNRVNLNKLVYLAIRALSVPAASSAVEHVFSHGGVILRPHHCRMSNKLLSNLIYLKCNKSLLPYWVLTNRSDWWCFTTLCVWSLLVLTVRCLNMKDTTTFTLCNCNVTESIIYAQYLYWYWHLKATYLYWYWSLKIRYWYLYWYLDHWYCRNQIRLNI